MADMQSFFAFSPLWRASWAKRMRHFATMESALRVWWC